MPCGLPPCGFPPVGSPSAGSPPAGSRLVVLDLRGASAVTDAALRHWLATGLQPAQLRRLCVADCRRLTDDTLVALRAQAAGLENLDVSGCLHFSARELGSVLGSMPRLKDATVADTDVDVAGVGKLLACARGLRRLDASDCPNVGDEVVSLATSPDGFAGLRPGLRALVLDHCPLLTDRGARAVIASNRHLRYLSLRNRRLTDLTLDALSSSWSLARPDALDAPAPAPDVPALDAPAPLAMPAPGAPAPLAVLDLSTAAVTDAGVAACCARLPGLQALVLGGCTAVGDGALLAVAASCGGLRQLELVDCAVTGVGLAAVAAACPDLRRVNLGKCQLLSDADVLALTVASARLELLSVSGCRGVTSAGLEEVAGARPGLALFYDYDRFAPKGDGAKNLLRFRALLVRLLLGQTLGAAVVLHQATHA